MHGHSPRNLRMQRYAFYSNPTNIIPNIFLYIAIFLSGTGVCLTHGA
jgi:hypothetical protein